MRAGLLASVLGVSFWLSAVHAQPVWQSSSTAVGKLKDIIVAKPAGTVQGDLLVVGIMLEKGSTSSITTPAGWTLIRRTDQGTNAGMGTYYKWAGASEPATYTFETSNSSKWAVGMSRISGAYTLSPIHASNGATGTSGTSVTAPSVTTTKLNTLVLAFYTNKKHATYTPASTTTERYDAPNSAEGLPSNMMATFVQATAGATGNKVATASEGESWVGQQIAIREPPPPPTGFNAFETTTAAGSLTGVIKTKRSGVTFSLAILAIRNGAQHVDIEGDVSVELIGNNTLGVALDANDCPASFTVLQTVSPFTVTGGRANINLSAVANSWRDVRVRVRWPIGAPSVTRCSSDNFALRPNTFTNFSVTDNDWQTAGTGRTLNGLTFGAVMHKAGQPFTVRATAVNGAGSPATTTNYTGTPTATLSACAGAACTASFGTLLVGTAASAGVLTSDIATYNNVGAFRVQLVDSDFANVDVSDGSTTAERNFTSGQLDVGRFVPDHFDVQLNTPQFAAACPGGGSTYVGAAFDYATAPVITVTARDFSNNVTTLYAGNWWRITNASLTGKAYTTATGSLDTSGDPATDPAIFANGDGTGTMTFSAGTGFFFTRGNPVAPFDAEISLAINVIDADGVAYLSNPARFGQASAGNGIGFDDSNPSTANDKQVRFGRLVITGANGSQLLPLAVRVEAQYYTTSGFITNTADNCTSLANNNVQMSGFTGSLAACETAISGAGTLSNGRGTFVLPAPGSANSGSVLLTANLGTSASGTTCTTVGGATVSADGSSRPYLQGAWSGSAYDDNPSGVVSFGTRRGADELIFVRENF
jgi:MSHA biogenesis protein MshQ